MGVQTALPKPEPGRRIDSAGNLLRSDVTVHMPVYRYRFVFFDKQDAQSSALILCHKSDAAAEVDAQTLLIASPHEAVEVWRGSQVIASRRKGEERRA